MRYFACEIHFLCIQSIQSLLLLKNIVVFVDKTMNYWKKNLVAVYVNNKKEGMDICE